MHRIIMALMASTLASTTWAATPAPASPSVIINNPGPGTTPIPLPPAQTSPGDANSCYIACYSHQKDHALTPVGNEIFVMGRVLVKGKYMVNKCVPDGYEGKDISQAPYFKTLCAQQIPACGNNCWAGGATNPASISRYRPLTGQLNSISEDYTALFPIGNKKVTVSIPSLSVESTGNPTVQIGGIVLTDTMNITSTEVNQMFANADINRLTIGDMTIGPIHIDGNVNNLNLKATATVIAMMNHMRNNERPSDADMQMIGRLIPQVITPSTTLKKNVMVNTPEGVMTLNTDIHWDATKPQPTTPQAMLQTANIAIAFKIAVPLVTKILTTIQTSMQSSGVTLSIPGKAPAMAPISPFEAMINAGIQRGYIIKDANNYQINITQQNGVLKINNNVINIPYNLGPALPPSGAVFPSTPNASPISPAPMANDIPTVQP